MNKPEEFREIQGTCGRYFISSRGRVRSMVTGKILKPFDTKGYFRVDIRINGVLKYITVHKLVSCAFLGPCPDGMQVNHKNMNKHDNNAENLEYVTVHENILHAWRNGAVSRKGEDHEASKLNNNDIAEIRRLLSEGVNQKDIALRYGVTRSNISCIKRKISWKHIK